MSIGVLPGQVEVGVGSLAAVALPAGGGCLHGGEGGGGGASSELGGRQAASTAQPLGREGGREGAKVSRNNY